LAVQDQFMSEKRRQRPCETHWEEHVGAPECFRRLFSKERRDGLAKRPYDGQGGSAPGENNTQLCKQSHGQTSPTFSAEVGIGNTLRSGRSARLLNLGNVRISTPD